MSGVAVLELVAEWLRRGRILAASDAPGNFACHEYVVMVSAIRVVHRWDTLTSTRMLVAVHAGRSAWLLSTHRMVRAMHRDTVNDPMQGELDMQQRVNDLEDDLLTYVRTARALEVQVLELRAALADARRR
jgi:hypothetical protein